MDLDPEEFLCRSQIIILRKTCAVIQSPDAPF